MYRFQGCICSKLAIDHGHEELSFQGFKSAKVLTQPLQTFV